MTWAGWCLLEEDRVWSQTKPNKAKRIGTFWLRRAAEQGHYFAKRKLEENGISPSEEPVAPAFNVLSIESIRAGLYWLVDRTLERVNLIVGTR